jgi:hypothetical protein
MTVRTLLLIASMLLAACASSPATRSASNPSTAVSKLGWLSGRWHGEMGATHFEETWSAPDGESMIGMFRVVENGTPGFYELMVLERDGSAVTMRMLHFAPKLAPHGRDGMLEYMLVATDGAGQATFETRSEVRVRRIRYQLRGKALDISLMNSEGTVVEQFSLSR